MRKRNIRRLVFALLAGACIAVAAILFFSQDEKTTYTMRFQNAGQLIEGNELRVAGQKAGTIQKIELTKNYGVKIKVDIDDSIAPLPSGTTAVIRATSLAGVANRYIELHLGSRNNEKLSDGATIPVGATTSPVDLDQLFNTFDPKTRGGLRNIIRGSATQYYGKEQQLRLAVANLLPALSNSTRLLGEVNRDQRSLTSLVVNGARVSTALAQRHDDLQSLLANTNTTMQALNDAGGDLDQTLSLLPSTLRQATATAKRTRSTLDDLDPLVRDARPVARKLPAFLNQLEPALRDAKEPVASLREIVATPGANNDVIDLLNQAPAFNKAAGQALPATNKALTQLRPWLAFAAPYSPDMAGWLKAFGQTMANRDANGHYARVGPATGLFSFSDDANGGLLTPVPPSERYSGYEQVPTKRCPGAASQPPEDGSAPYRGPDGNLDCDPSSVLPGP